MKPSESNATEVADEPIKRRAIAYYRSSLEHQSELSISLQQVQVRTWASENGVEIIREYSDVGKAASIREERPAFDEMMEELGKSLDIDYVLCVDASRIGRFQDDVRYIQLNVLHDKQLIYTDASQQAHRILSKSN